MTRDELIGQARRIGVGRAEHLTRAELRDEIVRRTEGDAQRRRAARGWFGVARDLVAGIVEAGLHLPDAARVIRGDVQIDARYQPPVATVTLAEIYAAQGHLARALRMLDEVLAKEPDHEVARSLRNRLAAQRAASDLKPAASTGVSLAGSGAEGSAESAAAAECQAGSVRALAPEDQEIAAQPAPLAGTNGIAPVVVAAEPIGAPASTAPGASPPPVGVEQPASVEAGSAPGHTVSVLEPATQPVELERPPPAPEAADAVLGFERPQPDFDVIEPEASRDPTSSDEVGVEPENTGPVGAGDAARTGEDTPSTGPEPTTIGEASVPAVLEQHGAGGAPLDSALIAGKDADPVAGAGAAAAPETRVDTGTRAPAPGVGADVSEPREDALFLARKGDAVELYWELTPKTKRRLRAHLPDASPVIRIVSFTPVQMKAERQQQDLVVEGAQGAAQVRCSTASAVRAALGWRTAQGFRPVAIATHLVLSQPTPSYTPYAVRAARDAGARARALEHFANT